MIKVFIDGMGRIGRAICKQIISNDYGLEIIGINDNNLAPSEIAYLLEHDSTGIIPVKGITGDDNQKTLTLYGKSIPVSRESIINNLPLGELRVTIVLDCTGVHSHDQLLDYIDAGAQKVLACYPARSAPLLVAYGVNNNMLRGTDSRVSLASCSTQAAAVLLQGLINGGLDSINDCWITTIRSCTNANQLLDNKGWTGRSAMVNILSARSNNIKGIGKVIPPLNGKCVGQYFRTSILDGGFVNLTINFAKPVTVEQINNVMRNFTNEAYEYSDEPLVSSDVVGNKSAVVFLPNKTQVSDDGLIANLVGLYDNENGFATQAIRTCIYWSSL